jgi:hypothetical protein
MTAQVHSVEYRVSSVDYCELINEGDPEKIGRGLL